jgi:hypothetical protein
MKELTGKQLTFLGIWSNGHQVILGTEGKKHKVEGVTQNTIYVGKWYNQLENPINSPEAKLEYNPTGNSLTIKMNEYLAVYKVH